MRKNLKYIVAIILIIIFTFSVVPKSFQNDTFYTIELGRCIIQNGIDWQDHYSIHKDLEYTYPHWAFDVINFKIFNFFGFSGVYIFTQIFASVFVLFVFWNMLRKEIDFKLAFISTLVVSFLMRYTFYSRGQIISYSIFLLEYILLENFVQRPTFFKTLALIVLSCLMANIHSTAWIFMLILILPFIGEQIVYAYSLKGINERLLRKYTRKLKNAKKKCFSEEKIMKIEKEIKHQEEFKIKHENNFKERKIIINKNERIKEIWVAVLALIIGALFTPIRFTPFLYFFQTKIGNSLNYINEHLPIVPANSLEFLSYTIIIVSMLGFTKSKLKLSDGFLILGLYLMAMSGRRNVYLLVGLTAGIVVKMIDDFIKDNNCNYSNKKSFKFLIVISSVSIIASFYFNIKKINEPFLLKNMYPVNAVDFIKKNYDYKNMRIFNKYEYGSYMLMNNIPVFIDSRCDLYNPEFNKNVNVFNDYMKVIIDGIATISDLMDKYKLKYALVPLGEFENVYMSENEKYKELYRDDYFIFYQYDLNY